MTRTILIVAAIAGLAGPVYSAKSSASIGRKIEGFSLRDFRGKTHELAELSDKQLVVVAFLGCECPLAKQYAPRLNKLAKEYGPQGVAFIGIDSNSQDSVTELAAYARLHEIEFPLL